jgi:hypothetical protein
MIKKFVALFVLASVSNVFAVSFDVTSLNQNSIATAQNLDAYFNLNSRAADGNDIHDFSNTDTSTTIPHVTVSGTGVGTVDYFSFTVTTPGIGIFDVDYSTPGELGLDSYITLYTAGGSFVTDNDDNSTFFPIFGDNGSVSSRDSFIQYSFSAPGTYVIAVGQYNEGAMGGISPGNDYFLHVSIENHAVVASVPDAGSTWVLLVGSVVVLLGTRRRSKV